MSFRIIMKLAFRSLFTHPLRSSLTIIGVTIGIAAIIFLVSFGFGLERLVTSQVANFNAFTIIDVPAANIKTIKVSDETIEKIKKLGHVVDVAPVTNIPGRIKKVEQSSAAETVVVAGNNLYWKYSDIVPTKGRLAADRSEVVLNSSIIKLIGEEKDNIIGKKISLELVVPPEISRDDSGFNSELNELSVVGMVESTDSAAVFTSLDLLAANNATNYSSLKVKSDSNNPDVINGLRKQIENIGFSTEYVGDTIDQISQVFALFRAVLAAFGLIALVVAALGTFNTLTISLLERIREIGLMKALGMRSADVRRLFIAESLLIGFLGGLFGLTLGYFGGYAIDSILRGLAIQSGADVISVFYTPALFALGVAAFSLIVGFVTGWYPSRRAVKINPLDALRYE